jgi:predicted lactoylglutathione lyase
MAKLIFVNLPVADLAASTRFYEAIGCRKNVQFSNEKACSMIWSDAIAFQLLTREYFQTFTPKPVADAQAACQVMLCLSRDSRQDVDGLADHAAKIGGRVDMRAPVDLGFLYNRCFEDPDGHVFELVWLNPDALMQPSQAASN